MQKNFIVLKLVINLLYLAIMSAGYFIGIKIGKTILDIPLFVIDFMMGMIGMGFMLSISGWLKNLLMSIYKFAHIYCISQGGKLTIKQSLLGCCKQFKNTLSLITVNTIINDCISYLADEKPEMFGLTKFFSAITDMLNSTLLTRLFKKVVKIQLSFVDEYVLYYCYKHNYTSFFAGVKDGFISYIKNAGNILEKIITVSIIGFIINMACRIIIIFTYFKLFDFSIQNVIWVIFILGNFTSLIVKEALMDTIMLKAILTSGDVKVDTDETIVNEEDFYILKELEKVQLGSKS